MIILGRFEIDSVVCKLLIDCVGECTGIYKYSEQYVGGGGCQSPIVQHRRPEVA